MPKFGLRITDCDVPTYFFDWLISDLESLEKSFLEFNEDDFLVDYSLCDEGLRLLCRHTMLRFQHELDFLKITSQGGSVSRDQMADEIVILRDKYIRRRKRLLSALKSSESPLLVRYAHDARLVDSGSAIEYASVVYSIVEKLRLSDPRLLILTKHIRTSLRMKHGNVVVAPIETDLSRPWLPEKTSFENALSLMVRDSETLS